MKRYLLLALTALLLLGSCVNYRDIDIVDAAIKDVRIMSASKYQVDVEVEIDNPTGVKFVLKEAEGILFKDGEPFADVRMQQETAIPAHGVHKVEVPCEVVVRNPLAALAIGLNYKSLDWNSFTIDAKGVIKGGPVKKKKEIKNIPLKKLYNYVKGKVK